MRFGQQHSKHLRMLFIRPIKSEAISLVLELPIKGKQQFYGTRKQESQFIMQLYGKIEEPKITVNYLRKKIMKTYLEIKLDYL